MKSLHRLFLMASVSATLLGASTLTPSEAQAFCGFYVSGADQEMYNNATMVVMMREGTKTVLSMRNNYEGPPEDFAMVIPVPQVLEEENVKVLKNEVFTRVDQLAAPRLVEYWERDPCTPQVEYKRRSGSKRSKAKGSTKKLEKKAEDLGVTIEAQFDVGEYNVVILSAKESNGLETYLKSENYNIPAGAAPVLKPYIEGGQYFFVAKVDPKKVKFEKGQARLSPLRFHYDSKEFSLPVRLGLLNAKGHQDLLVHILAKRQRYEVANYPNVTIPTNILVKDHVRESFGEFYATLLDRTLEENPKAVITEYAWDASTCDPCPTPALNQNELFTLGGDILEGTTPALEARPRKGMRRGRRMRRPRSRGWVLTRLHARYTKEDLGEDLIFKEADAIVGGRGTPSGLPAKLLEEGSKPGSYNNFQGRYIMLNPWEGEIACENPVRGVWGGPPSGSSQTKAAQDTAFVQRGKFELPKAFAQKSVPGLKLEGDVEGAPEEKPAEVAAETTPSKTTPAADTTAKDTATPPKKEEKKSNCSTTGTQHAPAPVALLGLLGVLGLTRRRKRD